MTTKTFEANEKNIEVAMASAVKQDELLSLLSQCLFVASTIAQKSGVELNENSTLVMVMSLPVDVKSRVVEILMEKAFIVGTSVQISVKDFEGKMVEWNRFVARVLMWNLSDFFEFLASVDLGEELKKGAVANTM